MYIGIQRRQQANVNSLSGFLWLKNFNGVSVCCCCSGFDYLAAGVTDKAAGQACCTIDTANCSTASKTHPGRNCHAKLQLMKLKKEKIKYVVILKNGVKLFPLF